MKKGWQDYVMSVGGFGFLYGILAQIVYNINNNVVELDWQFLVVTFVGMVGISTSTFSLRLYKTTIINIFVTLGYLAIIIHKIIL